MAEPMDLNTIMNALVESMQEWGTKAEHSMSMSPETNYIIFEMRSVNEKIVLFLSRDVETETIDLEFKFIKNDNGDIDYRVEIPANITASALYNVGEDAIAVLLDKVPAW